jgi:hypothetical protein
MGDPKTNAFELKLEKFMVSMNFLEVFQPFLSFFDEFENKRVHNMLDPRVKSLQFVINYIGHERTFTLVAQYDVGLLLPLLI